MITRCIVDLSSKEREGGEVAGVWGNGEQLILQVLDHTPAYLSISRWWWWWWGWQQHHHYDSRWKSSTHQTQLDEGSLKLIETETGETLNCQVCRLITRTTPPIRRIIPKLLKYYFKINIQNKYYLKKKLLKYYFKINIQDKYYFKKKLLKYYFKINIQNKYYFKKSCLNIISK